MKMHKIELSTRDVAIVLASLRNLKGGDLVDPDIMANEESVTTTEIADLCERINMGGD